MISMTPEQEIDEVTAERLAAELNSKAKPFRDLGFNDKQSLVLGSITHLSPATVRETFLKKGCSVDLAFEILRD